MNASKYRLEKEKKTKVSIGFSNHTIILLPSRFPCLVIDRLVASASSSLAENAPVYPVRGSIQRGLHATPCSLAPPLPLLARTKPEEEHEQDEEEETNQRYQYQSQITPSVPSVPVSDLPKPCRGGMAPSSYEMAASILLCAEDSSSILGLGAECEEEEVMARSRTRGEPSVDFPVPSEECVAGFVEAETAHMPREDYAERLRLRGGGLDLRIRMDAIDWIWKVRS